MPPGRRKFRAMTALALSVPRAALVALLLGAALSPAATAAAAPVIGIVDTGINPYHVEFSAARYPDPAVLEASANFTRHPSEWLPGYPPGA